MSYQSILKTSLKWSSSLQNRKFNCDGRRPWNLFNFVSLLFSEIFAFHKSLTGSWSSLTSSNVFQRVSTKAIFVSFKKKSDSSNGKSVIFLEKITFCAILWGKEENLKTEEEKITKFGSKSTKKREKSEKKWKNELFVQNVLPQISPRTSLARHTFIR